jgi:hypothetical protein
VPENQIQPRMPLNLSEIDSRRFEKLVLQLPSCESLSPSKAKLIRQRHSQRKVTKQKMASGGKTVHEE